MTHDANFAHKPEIPTRKGLRYEGLKEALCLGGTAARLYQAATLRRQIQAGEPTYRTIAEIVAVDVADGMVARALGVDTARRKMLDAAVDKATMATGFWEMAKKQPEQKPTVATLGAYVGAMSIGNAMHFIKNRETIKGGGMAHRLGGISTAGYALALNTNSQRLKKYSGGLAVGINLALGTDYIRAWNDPNFGETDSDNVRTIPGFSLFRRRR